MSSISRGIPVELKWKVLALAGAAEFAAFLVFYGLWIETGGSTAGGWLALTTISLMLLFGCVWRQLPANRVEAGGPVLSRLGAGTFLTIFRGVLLAYLTGFLALQVTTGWLGWLPGALFGAAIIADFFDGFLARRQGLQTGLGEWLDINVDAGGILIGCLIGVHFDRLPVWYLPVGLARYVFILAIRMRERSGHPVYELPESNRRRGLAGAQMVFITILLLPIYSPPATYYAAAVFMAVFLASFTYDWLVVSGSLHPTQTARVMQLRATLGTRFSILIRFFTSGLLFFSALEIIANGSASGRTPVLILLEIILAFMMAFGLAGRLAAVLILVLVGYIQMSETLALVEILLIFCASLVFFTGTGPLSLWSREGNLAGYRAGEEPSGPPES